MNKISERRYGNLTKLVAMWYNSNWAVMPKVGECNSSSFFMDTSPPAEGCKLVIKTCTDGGVGGL